MDKQESRLRGKKNQTVAFLNELENGAGDL